MQLWRRTSYPTTIINDRYGGTYSGGQWLAFPLDYYDVPEEIDGEDIECMMFWDNVPDDIIIGKGESALAALCDLTEKIIDRLVDNG